MYNLPQNEFSNNAARSQFEQQCAAEFETKYKNADDDQGRYLVVESSLEELINSPYISSKRIGNILDLIDNRLHQLSESNYIFRENAKTAISSLIKDLTERENQPTKDSENVLSKMRAVRSKILVLQEKDRQAPDL